MASRERHPAWLGAAAYGAAAVLVALYFFQSSTLAPNQTDEGLILQYIDAMAHGERPFFDFVDAYGLLNWVFPVAFYEAFGDRVWGIRMWMVLLKVITVGAAYVLVHGLTKEPARESSLPAGSGESEGRRFRGGRFYAALAALYTTVLLGVQWQSLQTTYAFLTVLPLVLFAWHFLLSAPLEDPKRNVQIAGVLTAMAIWTKLNTGMFLLAGGLFSYFFWMPLAFEPSTKDAFREDGGEAWLGRARMAGAVAYGVLFFLFIRRHFNIWFFLFLTVPLTLGLFWSVRKTARGTLADTGLRPHLQPFALYLATTLVLSMAILFGYYGVHAGQYARELSAILSHILYTAPFPPLGKPGTYVGLNEYYWLELPWLLTALFLVWTLIAERRGPSAFGEEWPRRRAQVSSLFILVTLHTFVMYARSDETHIYQALLLVAPVLFVVIAQLDSLIFSQRCTGRFPFRFGVGAFGTLYTFSLAVMPTLDAFAIGRTDWKNPKLEHLRYRRLHSPYVREFTTNLYDHDWDVADDETAAYVKSVSLPGEEMLLLTANRLVYFNSGTRPIGGRYHFFFYLASVGLLDRAGFDALVPKSVIDDILQRPPRVIVGAMGWVPLAVMFPEFKWLEDTHYEQTRHFRHIQVHELRIDGAPLEHPLR